MVFTFCMVTGCGSDKLGGMTDGGGLGRCTSITGCSLGDSKRISAW